VGVAPQDSIDQFNQVGVSSRARGPRPLSFIEFMGLGLGNGNSPCCFFFERWSMTGHQSFLFFKERFLYLLAL